MRWLNRLVPPNVYYVEAEHVGGKVRAKYALVSLGQLERLVGPATLNPYFWARFAQPTGLLWSRDPGVAGAIEGGLVQSILTTDQAVRPLVGAERRCGHAVEPRAHRELSHRAAGGEAGARRA